MTVACMNGFVLNIIYLGGAREQEILYDMGEAVVRQKAILF